MGVTGTTGHPHGAPGALQRCINVDPDTFAQRYWSREPLLSRGTATDFTDLLDASAVDELVSRRGLRTPFLRMANQGDVLPTTRFTRSGGSGATIADQVADDKVLRELADGATLVLQALHRTWAPVVQFSSALAAQLGHPVQVNAYVTPPQNQGFGAHYDNHDVFVLQVAGSKRWRIHRPVLVDPLPEQKWEQRRNAVNARAAEAPLIDTVLEPGDALYLPRGYVHSAVALGELSIHLTVGVHPVTRNALLRELIDATAADPALRASLPMGVDLADPEVLAEHLRATALALGEFAARIEARQVDAVAAKIGAALAGATRPEPIAPLAQSAVAASMDETTPLRARAGLRYSLTERADEVVVLSFLDRTLTLPVDARAGLLWALTSPHFTPAQLPGLDRDGQLVLARRLVGEALVVPASPSGGVAASDDAG